jgi:hypothetical protein
VSSDKRYSAARFRQRATEMRALSEKVKDENLRKTLLDIAEEYEGMARVRESDKPK